MARMSDPGMVTAIKQAVTIPVMAKARIGHFVEAQILEALDIDYIDESEVRMAHLLPAISHNTEVEVAQCGGEMPRGMIGLQMLMSVDVPHPINKHEGECRMHAE